VALPGTLTITVDRVDEIIKNVAEMTQQRLLVGIPDINAGRNTQNGSGASNAIIGYAMEFGLTGHGAGGFQVPPRPFLRPTIADMKARITDTYRLIGLRALEGDMNGMKRMMSSLGLEAANNVKKRISAGIPPPLATSTVEGRLSRTQKGSAILRRLRTQGTDLQKWGQGNLTPLIDTGQLRNAITYVIRKKPPQLWAARKQSDGIN
jgi:hypothetical protein